MTKEEKIYNLSGILQQRNADIRAEVLVNHAIENGFPQDGFVVNNNGFFYREFVKDILSSTVIEDSWYRTYIELQLSRPGFYDMLPEALFHQPETTEFRQRAGVAEMTERYKRNAAKEKEVRKFFQPLENEIFFQQMMLEREEVYLLDALKSKILNRYFINFWGLPTSLKMHEAASFLLLLPHASIINGNLALMQSCLSALLNEEVVMRRKEPDAIDVGEISFGVLGQSALGDYMVCGTDFMEDYPVLTYHIGPVKNSNISSFIEGGEKDIIINTFNKYFAPVEADVVVEIQVNKKEGGMSFDEGEEIILGYSSIM